MRPDSAALSSRALGLVLVLAIVAAYSNSFSGEFLYDDRVAVVENRSIQRLWPLSTVLFPPASEGVGGRPIANLSFALNHAIGGTSVRGYHVVNLVIHAGAALALFGLLRRTLRTRPLVARFGEPADLLAGASALWWGLHPVQSEVVSYVSQRTESLMALFFLLTLYGLVRGAQENRRAWHVFGAGMCVLGMAAKEVMVSAPLVALLYDRIFLAKNFRVVWRERGFVHLAFAASWLVLIALMGALHARGVDYGLGIGWLDSLLTQSRALATYAGLTAWPHPLIFDHGMVWLQRFGQAAPYLILVGAAFVGVILAFRRWPVAGFVGAWFFLILAPTSSFVPIVPQPIAENRMYLPLAALVAAGVLALHGMIGRRALWIFSAVAVAGAIQTWQRNLVYRSEISIWTDTIAKRPDNARAQYNLAVALDRSGRVPEAAVHYEAAIHHRAGYAEAYNNLGAALLKLGRLDDAITRLRTAVQLAPTTADLRYNLGYALQQKNQPAEAIPHYREALRLDPRHLHARLNLAQALLQTGAIAAAIPELESALRLDSRSFAAHHNLAVALAASGRIAESRTHYEAALRIDPRAEQTRRNLEALPAR
ncbi:MAG TPA: tetratricopeptide repeat protein [Opitutaceae bacterium]|nr:tetratricopeptide repeat protein [Opitutaceae bacterium]